MRQITPSNLCNDKPMWDIWMSLWHLPVVTAAEELGLFKCLGSKALKVETITNKLSLKLRPVEILSRMLTELGFLTYQQNKFQLTPTEKTYLLPNSPFYWGAQLRSLRERVEHARIVDVIRQDSYLLSHDNQSFTQMWEQGTITPEAAVNFTQQMHATIFAPAIAAVKKGIFSSTKCLLDMGGGSGCFAIAYSQKYPRHKAAVFELPEVCKVTKKYLTKSRANNKVSLIPGNFFKDTWPLGYDGILFSQIFHDWSLADCRVLAKKAYAALEPGGKIFVHEMLLNKTRTSPLTTACFDLLMYLNHRSQQFTKEDLFELLKETGFKTPKAIHTFGYYLLYMQ